MQPLPHRLAPADRLAATPREADEIADPALQAVLDPQAKVWGQLHGPAGRPQPARALQDTQAWLGLEEEEQPGVQFVHARRLHPSYLRQIVQELPRRLHMLSVDMDSG